MDVNYRRFSVYMTDDDMKDLDALRGVLDPAGTASRSELLRMSVRFVLEVFGRWQKAAKQEKNTQSYGALLERE